MGLAGPGCVRSYQPMSGLQRPVVVNPAHPNLDGLQVALSCEAWPPLSPQDASRLCDKVGTLLRNQGATIRGADPTPADAPAAGSPATGSPDADPPAAEPPAGPDLSLLLRARAVHQDRHPLSWLACAATFTLVPAWSEHVFAQEVQIRDGRGALLVDERLEGRTVRRFGAGALIGALLDQVARGPAEQVTGVAADRALSADLYGQLSQALYNAHVQDRLRRAALTGPG